MDRLAKVRAAVAELVAADPGQWTLDELGKAIPDMAQIGNQLLAGQFRVLAAFDARGGAQIAGDRTTGEWLTGATKMSRHHAGGMVATARALRDDLPATAAVLAAGQVTGEQVRAIRRAQRAFGEDFAPIEATGLVRRRPDRHLEHGPAVPIPPPPGPPRQTHSRLAGRPLHHPATPTRPTHTRARLRRSWSRPEERAGGCAVRPAHGDLSWTSAPARGGTERRAHYTLERPLKEGIYRVCRCDRCR